MLGTGQKTAACGERRVRVLEVFSHLGVGGAERWLLALLKYARDHGPSLGVDAKFDILITGGARGPLDAEAGGLGAQLIYLKYSKRTMGAFVREYRRLLRENSYDAIHDHLDHAAGFRFLFGFGRLPRTRIAHLHNPRLVVDSYASSVGRKLTVQLGFWLVRRFATHVLGTSNQLLREFGFENGNRGSSRVKVDAAYCGFDVAAFRENRPGIRAEVCAEFGWRVDVRLILFVGRLDTNTASERNQKNPLFALAVARRCIERDSAVHVLIAGKGGAVQPELEREVRSWGLEANIRFLGVRNDVSRLMLASDLLLFPSLAEGLGMVVVEAQAAGLPVLASDVVPREATVIPELVSFRPLAAGADSWATDCLRLLGNPPPNRMACNDAVGQSQFAIEQSTRAILGACQGAW